MVILREFAQRPDLLGLARRHPKRYPFFLESALQGYEHARYSILLAFPESTIVCDSQGLVTQDGIARSGGFLDALDAAWKAERVHASYNVPFSGGWFVYLGYEVAGEIEPRLNMPKFEVASWPRAVAVRCPAAIIWDHKRNSGVYVAEQGRASLIDAMFADVAELDGTASTSSEHRLEDIEFSQSPDAEFASQLAAIREYILAGDVFQVNISRRWSASSQADPSALYASLRNSNPAPFAGLMQWDGLTLLSSSPERLVESRNGWVQTRPIAGTRPRGQGERADEQLMHELIRDSKERAEHVMLIDLERNDLGRVCEPGSVEVNELMVVETYAHVHHIVSNVRGRLQQGVTPGQTLAAVFPGGTITGCPKVRCMEIIAELEPNGRGPYTGSMGYLNRNGDMDFNILIRTALHTGEKLLLRAGAGIVADSQFERELAETRSKAKGLILGLQGDN